MITGPQNTPPRLVAVRAADQILDVHNVIAARVLNTDMLERLTLLNRVVREIREMGIPIVSARVVGEFPSEGEPSVRIRRDLDRSIAPLLDAAGPRMSWMRRQGGRDTWTTYCTLAGVLILWEEPRNAA